MTTYPPPPDRRPLVGQPVQYWTIEGERLVENAALIVSVGADGRRCWLHVFYQGGFSGNDRQWAKYSATPMEGHWSWLPER